jgi:hypothetical protein
MGAPSVSLDDMAAQPLVRVVLICDCDAERGRAVQMLITPSSLGRASIILQLF